MGPLSRYLGPELPKKQALIWQDPLPTVDCESINDRDAADLKKQILAAPGVNVSSLITTAWGSASTFRISDKRGGANGARIALEPQVSWPSNNPARLKTVLKAVSLPRDPMSSHSYLPVLTPHSSTTSRTASTLAIRRSRFLLPI